MCHCFDVCTESSVRAFLTWYFPLVIERGSPYSEYVRSVYGDRELEHPIRTHDFQFVYSSARFQDLWPMGACRGNTKRRNSRLAVVGPRCSPSYCRPFEQRDAQRNTTRYAFEWYNSDGSNVMGVRWHDPATRVLPIRPMQWVEIARWPAFPETNNAYGTWFSLAKGSGVFINVGETYIAYEAGDFDRLEEKWAAASNLSLLPTAYELRRGFWKGKTRIPHDKLHKLSGVSRHEPYPYFAYELGMDSLQIMSPPQIVVTSRSSAVNSTCCPGCSMHQLAIRCSYRTSACGEIPYRSGHMAARPCVCSNRYGMTNCLG